MIDRRGWNDDPIQPDDVFGAFEARSGLITPDSYEANPTHRILSERGFFQLEEELLAAVLRQLEALTASRRPGS